MENQINVHKYHFVPYLPRQNDANYCLSMLMSDESGRDDMKNMSHE